MIKKLIYITLCCVTVLALSCTHENEGRIELSIDQMPLRLAATNAGLKTIDITTNVPWQVTIPTGAPWLTVTPTSGIGNCTVTVTAEDNDSEAWRTTNVTIKAGVLTKTVSVTQLGLSQLLPADAGAISGDNMNNCPFTNYVVLSVPRITGADSYQWYRDGVPVAVTIFPTFTAMDAPGTYAYTVAGKNATGEGTPSPEKRITIVLCDPPGIPVISGDNANVCPEETVVLSITATTNATSYQWYRNGATIAGATGLNYTVTQSGTYTVEAINVSATSGESAPHVVEIEVCVPTMVIFEDVESHTDWAINSPGTIGWTYYGSGKPTYGYSSVSYPGMGSPAAYVVINPALTTPPVTGSQDAHSGTRFFACFNPDDASMADAWIVSPLLDYTATFKISFWARSLTNNYGAERFKVGYSTTGNAKANFTTFVTPGSYVQTTEAFVKYTYDIPATAKYVAIQCVSVDAFALFIDDIYIGMGPVPAPSYPAAVKNIIVDDIAKYAVKAKK